MREAPEKVNGAMIWLTVFLLYLPIFSKASLLRAGRPRVAAATVPPNSSSHADEVSRLSEFAVNSSHHSRNVSNRSFAFDFPIVSTLFSNRSSKREVPPPKMFVAVFTTRGTPTAQRESLRRMWSEVDADSGHICVRYVVCEGNDVNSQSLLAESQAKKDILFLQCEEGYAQGLLTKKVITTMRAFHAARNNTNETCLNRPLFMKVDHDTFVSGHRFRLGLSEAVSKYGENIYAGVDLPTQPANRDPNSHWYEPLQTWPHPNYPPAMYGGPGYVLGRPVIQRILDDGIVDAHFLWNEDRAVGVWVNVLQSSGFAVNWVRVPGTNGFSWDFPVKLGLWGNYPYVLHHHVSQACIMCLTDVDFANNPLATVDQCFMYEAFQMPDPPSLMNPFR
jgi:hypothetical protein